MGLRLWFSCEFGLLLLGFGVVWFGALLCGLLYDVVLWLRVGLVNSVVARYLLRGFYCVFMGCLILWF